MSVLEILGNALIIRLLNLISKDIIRSAVASFKNECISLPCSDSDLNIYVNYLIKVMRSILRMNNIMVPFKSIVKQVTICGSPSCYSMTVYMIIIILELKFGFLDCDLGIFQIINTISNNYPPPLFQIWRGGGVVAKMSHPNNFPPAAGFFNVSTSFLNVSAHFEIQFFSPSADLGST